MHADLIDQDDLLGQLRRRAAPGFGHGQLRRGHQPAVAPTLHHFAGQAVLPRDLVVVPARRRRFLPLGILLALTFNDYLMRSHGTYG